MWNWLKRLLGVVEKDLNSILSDFNSVLRRLDSHISFQHAQTALHAADAQALRVEAEAKDALASTAHDAAQVAQKVHANISALLAR